MYRFETKSFNYTEVSRIDEWLNEGLSKDRPNSEYTVEIAGFTMGGKYGPILITKKVFEVK